MDVTSNEATEKENTVTLISAQQPDPVDDWNNLKDYMKIKQRKLLNQFNSIGHKLSDIFKGVSIYVNGFTEPSADELKTLIHDHGGAYCYHYSPSRVTHIITCNLPDTKVKNLSTNVIVCTPSWVVDSIAAGRLLPVNNYRLYHSTNEQGSLNFSVVSKRKNSASASVIKKAKILDSYSNGVSDLEKPSVPTDAANLISEFYTHSRLHHLSMWSTELKEFTARKRTQIIPKLVKLSTQKASRKDSSNVFVHIDLDCFFVSVGLKDRPQLVGKPVAVSHFKGITSATGNPKETDKRLPTESMSDIASCNYKARDKGVHNGMSIGKGLQQCPDLVIIPYEFEKYQNVSHTFYEILLSYLPEVEAVSCDEAYLELTDYVTCTSEACEIVEQLRTEIYDKTQCHASAGIAHNMLLARLSTRVAKPCGQFCLLDANATEFLGNQLVSNLPGVGYSTASKLSSLGIVNCQQLSQLPMAKLHSEFGKKVGTTLYNFARGIDNRSLTLEADRKSLSADVNFGIRFQSFSDADEFIVNLAKEVERRAIDSGVVGKQVTLKLKVRKADAPIETKKYLGHGICYNISKSTHLPTATCKATTLQTACIQILRQLNLPVTDIRGIGIQLTKLNTAEEKIEYADLRKTFARSQVTSSSQLTHSSPVKPAVVSSSSTLLDESFDIPPASQLDASVFEALPDHYKKKISESYARGKAKETPIPMAKHNNTPTVIPSIHEPKNSVNIHDNIHDDIDVMDVFAYLKEWLQNSKEDGPDDSDVQLFGEYMLGLLDSHMDVAYRILRHLWRKINGLQLAQWKPVYLQLLASVQETMQEKYHTSLNTDFML